MLTWTVVYTARPVLAALQTSYRSRRNAAAVTPREPQSRDVRVWLVAPKTSGGHGLPSTVWESFRECLASR